MRAGGGTILALAALAGAAMFLGSQRTARAATLPRRRTSSATPAPSNGARAADVREAERLLSMGGTDRARASARVQAAQIMLNSLNYDPGPIDGRFGQLTRNALNDFQRDGSHPVTSTLTNAALEALRSATQSEPAQPTEGWRRY